MGEGERADGAGGIRQALREGHGIPLAQGALRIRRLRRRRPQIFLRRADRDREGLALPFRANPFSAAHRRATREAQGRLHGRERLRLPRPARSRRRSFVRRRGRRFEEEYNPHHRVQLRRRDEEGYFYDNELPVARARRVPDALFYKRRRGWRRGVILRPVGDRKDDALRRPQTPPCRRRRDRLERRRLLQLRGRLLRQGYSPFRDRRAADLLRHQVRFAFGERYRRPGDPGHRLRRRQHH